MAGSAGETTGLSLAEVILLGFEGIKEADKLAFFNYIATSMKIDSQAVCTAFDPYEREPTKDRYRRYMAVSEPRRQEFIPRLNQVPGATLPDGEVGQIEVRVPNEFKGYGQMPEKTAAKLRDDGFFITGDLGRIDADGYVHIVDRNKDLIISGGYNIYPKEIELVLDEKTGALESAVIGVPHPDFGETVLGTLVPEAGQSPDTGAIMAAV